MAVTAAQAGTVTGLGAAVGEATGLDDGLGLRLGLGLSIAVGLAWEGLACPALELPGEHAEPASTTHTSTKPVLTGDSNEPRRTAVTQFQ
ncbi:MAG: hypothetical protein ACHQ0J_12185 [Candidatus Dormibacterales bacterium]